MMVYPEYISFEDWAASLFVDYPGENLPIPPKDEKEWEDWGAIVANTGAFSKAASPSPTSMNGSNKVSAFSSWQEWAKVAYIAMINQPSIKKTSL